MYIKINLDKIKKLWYNVYKEKRKRMKSPEFKKITTDSLYLEFEEIELKNLEKTPPKKLIVHQGIEYLSLYHNFNVGKTLFHKTNEFFEVQGKLVIAGYIPEGEEIHQSSFMPLGITEAVAKKKLPEFWF